MNTEWFLIIHKENPLQGTSFVQIINIICSKIELSKALFDIDLQGTTLKNTNFYELTGENDRVLSILELNTYLAKVIVEWGNIFLFDEVPSDWEEIPDSDYLLKISKSTITIRAADSNYILIYTKSPSLFEMLKPYLKDAVLESGPLNKLWYPE